MIYYGQSHLAAFARPEGRIGLNEIGYQINAQSAAAPIVTFSPRRRALLAIRHAARSLILTLMGA